MSERTILHVDLNNFYASVAQLYNPELKGKAFVISGNPETRHGVVLAKNEIAKKAGIVTGETLADAKRKVKNLYAMPTDFSKYAYKSAQVKSICAEYTPLIESFGLDECWLDVTGSVNLFGNGEKIAEEIRKRVKIETGLTVSIGVSFNKVFAKLGSDLKKPDAVTVINKENFRTKIWNLPVNSLLFVGKSLDRKLQTLGIVTIGDLAKTDETTLKAVTGKSGAKLYQYANGEDDEEVDPSADAKAPESISNGITAPKDIDNYFDAKSLIYSLSDIVAYRLRKHAMIANGISIGICDNKLVTFSRQEKLLMPTIDARVIAETAFGMLKRNFEFLTDRKIRGITIGTYLLKSQNEYFQDCFFVENKKKTNKIDDKIGSLREKYGFGIVKRAIQINPGFSCSPKETGIDNSDKK